MKTKNIFCIVGRVGSGKSYFFNSIIKDQKFMKKTNLSILTYGTTRDKKEYEEDGEEYIFISEEDFEKIPKEDLVESRTYGTLTNEINKYFTKKEYIQLPDTNLICISSLYQYESYRNWINIQNLSSNQKYHYKLFLIIIEASAKDRINRALKNKCKGTNDIYEICRRFVEEKAEYEIVSKRVPELYDPMAYPEVLYINNDDSMIENTNFNLERIKTFILNKIQ